MTEFQIKLSSTQLETGQLDAHDKIKIASHADRVWVDVEMALLPLDHYLNGPIEDIPAGTSFIEEPIEEYIETVRLLEKTVTTEVKDIEVIQINRNHLSFKRVFESYENARAWAEEIEDRTSELPSVVTLEPYKPSSEVIEKIEIKHQYDL